MAQKTVIVAFALTGSPRTRGDGPSFDPARPAVEAFSPHTRGWPGVQPGDPPNSGVLPAHAGMARTFVGASRAAVEFSPHTRGWPGGAGQGLQRQLCSPRTRGDGPTTAITPRWVLTVLPAHAGMARACTKLLRRARGVLPAHAGMARLTALQSAAVSPFSPHTRGWPGHLAPVWSAAGVLPAHAGMARAEPCRR